MQEFESLYRQYFHFVWRSVRRLGVPESAVDDAIQEVFLVIYAKVHSVEKPESLRSWIYGITRRVASQHRRSREQVQTAAQAEAIENEPSRGPSPFEETEQAARVALLHRVLGELSEAKREVFVLVELEEMAVPEVAEALEIPLNTAYSRLRHARLEFETALSRRLASDNRRGHS